MPYSDRYVAFIDILGFSEAVQQSATDAARYESLLLALTKIGKRREIGELIGVDFQFQSFSDSIVMSETASAEGLTGLIHAIVDLTLLLLGNGILLRGGIAKGKLHHEANMMFGPAYLEAYRLESTIANVPRVVLSRQVHSDYQAFVASRVVSRTLVKLADDGPPFIDYLSQVEEQSYYRSEIQRYCTTIRTLLGESIYEPRHYAKLRWLALYWNSKLSSWPSNRIPLPQLELGIYG